MDEQTRVNTIQVRERRKRLQPPVLQDMQPATSSTLTELAPAKKGLRALLDPDALGRNLALVGCLALVIMAAGSLRQDPGVSVFSALQSEMTAAWDEDVGKLSFVSELLPPEVQAVWLQQPAVTVMAPVTGDILHAWSEAEPYVTFSSAVTDVRAAADGEVMSIAHGLEEERIIRLRHTDGHETLYGNLADCFVDVGDAVEAGEIIATLIHQQPLAFELRVDGRSVDPSGRMEPVAE